MSKLPNHGLWARATTSAAASSSSGRAVSVLAKPHQQNVGQTRSWQAAAPLQQQQPHAVLANEAATLAALGGVSAPYYGPQPAAVVLAYEQRDQVQPQTYLPESSPYTISLPSLVASFGALNSATSHAHASTSFLAPQSYRSGLAMSSGNGLVVPHPHRTPQMWTRAYRSSATSASASASTTSTADAMTQSKAGPVLVAPRSRHLNSRLLFDVSENTTRGAKGKAAQKSSAAMDAELERIEDFFTSLWSSAAKVDQSADQASTSSLPRFSNSTSAHSRSPSPKSSSPGEQGEVGPRGLQQDVREPPPKFAVTTSAESTLSSGTGAAESANATGKAGNSAAACNTMTLSASSSASNTLPQDGAATDQWARHFNIPRAYKRHDFMFEHGAYGIPKRHPLSSIRKASLPSASGNTDSRDGRAPRRDQVASSRVQAAQDMLSAAADFLAGSQHASSSSRSDHYHPSNGQDALRAAFSGGSTADGRELRNDAFSQRKGTKKRAGNPHRMAIRGTDGRIIKDRLRSVQVGEDAYFLRPDSLGVADGVGGWASRVGADPALFSRLLMHFCAVELSRYDGLSASELAAEDGSMLKAWAAVDPVEVMHRAWERCVRASRREGILGSSTALIALLRGDELRIANMGDCVLMIVRGGEMIFRSTEQQHSFNFPVQLGMMGDTSESLKKHASSERAAGEGEISGAPLDSSEPLEDYDDVDDHTRQLDQDSSGGSDVNALPPGVSNGASLGENGDDEPAWDEPRRDAGRWTVRVEAGDIIVVGSDGLMDNLFDEDIMEEVVRFLPKNPDGEPDQEQLRQSGAQSPSSAEAIAHFSPQLVSEALCSRAKAVSEDSRAISSPFQQRAMEEGLNYVGGKHDDISVLVCLVGERDLLDADSASPTSPQDKEAAPSDGKSRNSNMVFLR